MTDKKKLDLHTHCYEALGYAPATMENTSRIVEAIKAKRLDGIAITEHDSSDFAFEVKRLVEQCFDKNILIIPGRELNLAMKHIVELYLPTGVTFRFLAHPTGPWEFNGILDGIHGIEIENSMHNIPRQKVREIAEQNNLMLLRNSDAHYIEDIGSLYNEISLEELSAVSPRSLGV